MKGTIKFRLEWLNAFTEMDSDEDISDIIWLMYKHYDDQSKEHIKAKLIKCSNTVNVVWLMLEPMLDKPLDTESLSW